MMSSFVMLVRVWTLCINFLSLSTLTKSNSLNTNGHSFLATIYKTDVSLFWLNSLSFHDIGTTCYYIYIYINYVLYTSIKYNNHKIYSNMKNNINKTHNRLLKFCHFIYISFNIILSVLNISEHCPFYIYIYTYVHRDDIN